MKFERIFIPVSYSNTRFVMTEYSADGKFHYDVEEREGVIVFTPQELKELFLEYESKSIPITRFLKSKGLIWNLKQ